MGHSDSFPPRLSTPKLQKIYTITQMDKAKAAVGSFLHKDGKHDTTVHETVNPAVTQENVTRTQHENVTTAVDREVHQDHHHTSVQPIKDREVLPEQHNHQMAGVETRNLKHGNDEHVKERLQLSKPNSRMLVLSEIPNTPLLPIQPLLASTSTTTSMKTSNL